MPQVTTAVLPVILKEEPVSETINPLHLNPVEHVANLNIKQNVREPQSCSRK